MRTEGPAARRPGFALLRYAAGVTSAASRAAGSRAGGDAGPGRPGALPPLPGRRAAP